MTFARFLTTITVGFLLSCHASAWTSPNNSVEKCASSPPKMRSFLPFGQANTIFSHLVMMSPSVAFADDEAGAESFVDTGAMIETVAETMHLGAIETKAAAGEIAETLASSDSVMTAVAITRSVGSPLEIPIVAVAMVVALIVGHLEDEKKAREDAAARAILEFQRSFGKMDARG